MTDRTRTDPPLTTYAPAVPAPALAGAAPRLDITSETSGSGDPGTTHVAVRTGAATTAAPTASAATAAIQATTGTGGTQVDTSPLRTWAAETIGKTLAATDLPTTEQITENLAAVRDSALLHEAKQLPLSRAGAAAVEHVEKLLASTEDLVAAKSKHDEVQQMLRHGALAAQKVKESSAISESIAKTFGEATTAAEDTASIASRESATSSAAMLAQQFMHKMFDVTRRLVASSEFRSLLQDIAGTVGDFLSAAALSQLHGAAGALQEGETDDDRKARAEAEQAKDKAEQVKDAVAKLKEPARRLLARVRDQPEFQAGIRDVIDLFALVRDRAMLLAEQQKQGAQAAAESVAENVAETAEDREVQYHAEQAAEKAQQLIANFGGTLDPLRDATHRLLDALNKKRPEVDQLVDEMRDWASDPGDEKKAQAVYDRVRHLLALVKPEAAVQVSQYAEGTVLPALTQAKETVKDVAEQVKEKAQEQLPEEVAPYVRDAAEGAAETAEAAEGEWHTVTYKRGKKGKKQQQEQEQQQAQTEEQETTDETEEDKAKNLPGIGAWTEQDEQDARELRESFEQVAKEARTFLDSLRSDATVRNVEASLTALMHDLFLDDKGAPQLKVDLLADLQKVLPLIVRRLATVPVARIDYADEDLDLILDNVELDCVLAPANVNLVTETHWAPDLGQVVSTAKMQMRGMRVDARNVVFYYNRKRFPKVADVGIADVVIGGDSATTMSHEAESGTDEATKAHARAQLAAGTVGMDIDMTLQPARDPTRLVHVVDCTATIHDLRLDVKRTRHPWMYTLLSPVLDRYLRARLEQATADMVAGAVERLDRVVEQAMAQGKAMQEQMHPGATLAAALSSVGGSREE